MSHLATDEIDDVQLWRLTCAKRSASAVGNIYEIRPIDYKKLTCYRYDSHTAGVTPKRFGPALIRRSSKGHSSVHETLLYGLTSFNFLHLLLIQQEK